MRSSIGLVIPPLQGEGGPPSVARRVGWGSPTPARFARRPSPASRYRIYTSHDSDSQTQERPLILGHFPHSATRKGQFGVSRCFDSSLGICVDTVAQVRGRGGEGVDPHESTNLRAAPHPIPPAEVGCFRLRPVNEWPNSGKPEFGCKQGREPTEFAASRGGARSE